MTELKRERVSGKTAAGNREVRWQVVGPHGAIALHSVAGHYAGLAAHRRNSDGPDLDSCDVLSGEPCEVDALNDRLGRELHALRDDAGLVIAALVREYSRVWPEQTGRCGESVPQANYGTEDVS